MVIEGSEKFLNYLCEIYKEVSEARASLEAKWRQYLNIWKGEGDVSFYDGFSRVYVNQTRKIVEQGIVNFQNILIPQKYPYAIKIYDEKLRGYAEAVKKFTDYQLDQLKLKFNLDIVLRQLLMFGTAVVKTVWIQEKKRINGKEVITKSYTSFLPINLFDFYVYPSTARDMSEVYATFEKKYVTLDYLKEKEREGIYQNVEQLKRRAEDVRIRERVEKIPIFEIIEAWIPLEIEEGKKVPCVAVFSAKEKVLLRCERNPYNHQEIPYVVGRYLQGEVNQFYGSGVIEGIQRMQYALNDFTNLTLDNMIFSLCPITVVDPTKVYSERVEFELAPGATWKIEPAAISFMALPDVSGVGINAITYLKTSIEEMAGLGPTPLLAVPRETATEAGMVAQAANMFIAERAKVIEEEILTPFLMRNHVLTQQFLTKKDIGKVIGELGLKYEELDNYFEALMGHQDIRWLATAEAIRQMVTVKQMGDFLGAIGHLQAPDFRINFPYILKKLWREGFGFVDSDEIIIDLTAKANPYEENELLLVNKKVTVKPADDDLYHMQVHYQGMQKTTDINIVEKFREHISAHAGALDQKEMQRAQQMLQIQQMMAQMQPPEEIPIPEEEMPEEEIPGEEIPEPPFEEYGRF